MHQGIKLGDNGGWFLRRGEGGVLATDGPYAEAKEVIGGLYMIEAENERQAQELASACPTWSMAGSRFGRWTSADLEYTPIEGAKPQRQDHRMGEGPTEGDVEIGQAVTGDTQVQHLVRTTFGGRPEPWWRR